jgi:hypothetical protein
MKLNKKIKKTDLLRFLNNSIKKYKNRKLMIMINNKILV